MASERILGILQTPADENGVRYDVDLVTSADAVIYDSEMTLKEKLEQLTPTISNIKPSHPGLWFEVLRMEDEDGNVLLDQLPIGANGGLDVDTERNVAYINRNNITNVTKDPDDPNHHRKLYVEELWREVKEEDNPGALVIEDGNIEENPEG